MAMTTGSVGPLMIGKVKAPKPKRRPKGKKAAASAPSQRFGREV